MIHEKEKAISLRKKGLSYSEILKQIPVAKSTLSLWLREVGLSEKQRQKLTLKKLEAAKRGAAYQREKRLLLMKAIKEHSKSEIERINIGRKELWLMGIMLYWAEGTKEKENGHATSVQFSNSDPFMIKLFLRWLFEICKVSEEQVKYEIYIHESNKPRVEVVKRFWAEAIGIKIGRINSVYFKKHKLSTPRKNIDDGYNGLLKVRVRKSSSLNRRIAGWIEAISQKVAG